MSTHFFKIEEHVVPGQHIREYPNGARSDDDVLELAVKHYTPLEPTQNGSSGGPSVTIIAGHANGFPKVSPSVDPREATANRHTRNATNRSSTSSSPPPEPKVSVSAAFGSQTRCTKARAT